MFTFVTSAFFEYGGHSFAEALIVGRCVCVLALSPRVLPTFRSFKITPQGVKYRLTFGRLIFSKFSIETKRFVAADAPGKEALRSAKTNHERGELIWVILYSFARKLISFLIDWNE